MTSKCLLQPNVYFSLPGWTGSYIFKYLKATFQPVGSSITSHGSMQFLLYLTIN